MLLSVLTTNAAFHRAHTLVILMLMVVDGCADNCRGDCYRHAWEHPDGWQPLIPSENSPSSGFQTLPAVAHHISLSFIGAALQEDVDGTHLSLLCLCALLAGLCRLCCSARSRSHLESWTHSASLGSSQDCDVCCMQINSLDLALANGTMLTITPQSQPHLWKAAQVSLSP